MTTLQEISSTFFIRTNYGFVMPISPQEPATLPAYQGSQYELEESRFIASHIYPGDYCVDLGARHGWFTGIMAARCGSSGHVYAFEPANPAAGVRDLIAANHFHWVTLFPKGASNKTGVLAFDNVSLSVSESGCWSIKTVRLDDAIAGRKKPIKIIKMDIEGAEQLALEGAANVIYDDKPIIVTEIYDELLRNAGGKSADDLYSMLIGLDYSLYSLDNNQIDRELFMGMVAEGRPFNVVFWPNYHPNRL